MLHQNAAEGALVSTILFINMADSDLEFLQINFVFGSWSLK
jgi:hypothetical protein